MEIRGNSQVSGTSHPKCSLVTTALNPAVIDVRLDSCHITREVKKATLPIRVLQLIKDALSDQQTVYSSVSSYPIGVDPGRRWERQHVAAAYSAITSC